jgi:hypothetical protein
MLQVLPPFLRLPADECLDVVELLHRLLAALPDIESWIDDLHARHRIESVPASELPYPRLARIFPADPLNATRVARVSTVPFPPVSAYGLPEFQAMADVPMAGITFADMYFVDAAHASAGTHFHELVHVLRWKALRVRPFLLTYALGILQYGYERSPLEAIAFGLQAEFERGTTVGSITERVTRHALQARDAAALVFRENELDIDA